MTEEEVRKEAIKFMKELETNPDKQKQYETATIEEVLDRIRKGETL